MMQVQLNEVYATILEPFQASVEEAVRRYALEKAHARLWELEQTIQRWEDKYGCGYDLFAYRTATDAAYVAQLELIQKRRNGRAMLSPGNSIRLYCANGGIVYSNF